AVSSGEDLPSMEPAYRPSLASFCCTCVIAAVSLISVFLPSSVTKDSSEPDTGCLSGAALEGGALGVGDADGDGELEGGGDIGAFDWPSDVLFPHAAPIPRAVASPATMR